MTHAPHTPEDRAAMLAALGLDAHEDLFADVPEAVRFPEIDLPPRLSEMEITGEMAKIASANRLFAPSDRFLGAGIYNHYIPPTVDYVLRRGEFYTAYTPYQPEISQGMLQAMFEYQSMICRLTGLDVANASHYDGATALAEAALMALDVTRGDRDRILVSPTVNPRFRAVLRTHLRGAGAELAGDEDGLTGSGCLTERLDSRTAAVVIQDPDFFGQFAQIDGFAQRVHAEGALLITVVDPIALGLFRAPGSYGADIAVAEGQPLGIPQSFGGPHLGVFATRREHLRRIAGRLVGETRDTEGRRGYVLTLGTREQHIRRARATSNICTNAALSALAAAVYLATVGKSGLGRIARLCHDKAHFAADRLAEIPGVEINPQAPDRPYFKEFVARLPAPVEEVNVRLAREHGLLGGYDLGQSDAALEGHMLLAVTETNTRSSIDRLVSAIASLTK